MVGREDGKGDEKVELNIKFVKQAAGAEPTAEQALPAPLPQAPPGFPRSGFLVYRGCHRHKQGRRLYHRLRSKGPGCPSVGDVTDTNRAAASTANPSRRANATRRRAALGRADEVIK